MTEEEVLQKYINLPGFMPFEVQCVDDVALAGEIKKGKIYTVLGILAGFFIVVNDRMKMGKYFRDRFILVEYEEKPEESL